MATVAMITAAGTVTTAMAKATTDPA
jgi:hypothetical protein